MGQLLDKQNFIFPFQVSDSGGIRSSGGDDNIRGKILQILFTARGERVNQPEFGCGLLDMVFDLNDPILAASVEFTIGQALVRWLPNDIRVEAVNVATENEKALVEVAYLKQIDMLVQAVRITF